MEKNAKAPDLTSMVGFPMRAGLRARCYLTTFVMSMVSVMQTARITLTIVHRGTKSAFSLPLQPASHYVLV